MIIASRLHHLWGNESFLYSRAQRPLWIARVKNSPTTANDMAVKAEDNCVSCSRVTFNLGKLHLSVHAGQADALKHSTAYSARIYICDVCICETRKFRNNIQRVDTPFFDKWTRKNVHAIAMQLADAFCWFSVCGNTATFNKLYPRHFLASQSQTV